MSEQGRDYDSAGGGDDSERGGVQGGDDIDIARAAGVCENVSGDAAGVYAVWGVRDSDQAAAGEAAESGRGLADKGDSADAGLAGAVYSVSDTVGPAVVRGRGKGEGGEGGGGEAERE